MPRAKAPTLSKPCEKCGTPIFRDRNGIRKFLKRKFCSKACNGLAQSFIPERVCGHCGKVFHPKHNRGKFCGRACAGKNRVVDAPKRKRRYPKVGGKPEHRVVMSRVLNRPLTENEAVHHKNGNSEDNRPENLELWTRYHPTGQRVQDLVDYVVNEYPELVAKAMNERRPAYLAVLFAAFTYSTFKNILSKLDGLT